MAVTPQQVEMIKKSLFAASNKPYEPPPRGAKGAIPVPQPRPHPAVVPYDVFLAGTREDCQPVVSRLIDIANTSPAQKTDGWLTQRLSCISGTGVSAVIGIDPYKTRASYIKGRVEGESFFGNAATAHGERYEPVSGQIFLLRNGGMAIEMPLVHHQEYGFIGASPDFVAIDSTGYPYIVEFKNPKTRIPNGNVPAHYLPQIQTQLACTGLSVAIFCDSKFEEYESEAEADADDSKEWGVTKGVIAESSFATQGKVGRFYPPLGSKEEQLAWLNGTNGSKRITLRYWRLEMMHQVQVNYDDDLFLSWLPDLETAWVEICDKRKEHAARLNDEKEALIFALGGELTTFKPAPYSKKNMFA